MPVLLGALARQTGLGERRFVACFHFDNCIDASEHVVRDICPKLPFTVVSTSDHARGPANAGVARRAAMALGLAALDVSGEAALLSTDADSVPADDWIASSLRALGRADIVAGRIARRSPERDPIQTRLETYRDRLHACRRTIDQVAWDDAPGHHWSGGASLAFRASVYEALGGFSARPAGEDAFLLDEAARAGWRVRRDRAVMVTTSARRTGRAPGGFAEALRQIDAMGEPSVAHPSAALWQYRAQAEARRSFERLADPAVRASLSDLIGLSVDHLSGVARDCRNAEAFAMRIVPAVPGGERLAPLSEAEAALRVLDSPDCERAA